MKFHINLDLQLLLKISNCGNPGLDFFMTAEVRDGKQLPLRQGMSLPIQHSPHLSLLPHAVPTSFIYINH